MQTNFYFYEINCQHIYLFYQGPIQLQNEIKVSSFKVIVNAVIYAKHKKS